MINNFLNPYQSNIPYQATTPVNNAPPTNVNWVRVASAEETRNQVVQPNSQIWLMNTNEPIFYVKSADALGISTLKAYKFEEIPLENQEKLENLKKSDIEQMIKDILNENKEKVGIENGKPLNEQLK